MSRYLLQWILDLDIITVKVKPDLLRFVNNQDLRSLTEADFGTRVAISMERNAVRTTAIHVWGREHGDQIA